MERLFPKIFILAGIAAKPFRNIHWYRVGPDRLPSLCGAGGGSTDGILELAVPVREGKAMADQYCPRHPYHRLSKIGGCAHCNIEENREVIFEEVNKALNERERR